MGLYENNNGTLGLLAGGTLYADAPVGSIQAYGGTTAPWGWLLCQGQAVSRATYAELFGVIGTSFGAGDGSSTFNVPDLRGKVPVGYNSSESEFNALGKTGGEKTHQLTVTEIPTHNHRVCPNGIVNTATGSGGYGARSWLSSGEPYNVTTEPIGGNGAHNNLQPYTTINYIIKATTIALPSDFEAAVDEKIALKQNITDNSLTTTAKTIVGGINELNDALYFKSGDTYKDVFLSAGGSNNNGRNVDFDIYVPKSLKNITSVSASIEWTGTHAIVFNNTWYQITSANSSIAVSAFKDNKIHLRLGLDPALSISNTATQVWATIALTFT